MRRKSIILLMIILLVTGCGNKSESVESSNETTGTTSSVTTEALETAIETTTDSTKTTTKATTTVSTSTKTTTKATTKTTTTMAKNMYKSVSDGKWHKYTYTYNDEATCNSNGNSDYADAFDYYEAQDLVIRYWGCEKVESQSGETLYGLYYIHSSTDSVKYYY